MKRCLRVLLILKTLLLVTNYALADGCAPVSCFQVSLGDSYFSEVRELLRPDRYSSVYQSNNYSLGQIKKLIDRLPWQSFFYGFSEHKNSQIFEMLFRGYNRGIKYLIDKSSASGDTSILYYSVNEWNWSMAHLAAYLDNVEALRIIGETDQDALEHLDNGDWSPIRVAARYGSFASVKFLLSKVTTVGNVLKDADHGKRAELYRLRDKLFSHKVRLTSKEWSFLRQQPSVLEYDKIIYILKSAEK